MKALKDFDYSLDGIHATSFKKGEVVRVSVVIEGKMVKAGLIGNDDVKAQEPAPVVKKEEAPVAEEAVESTTKAVETPEKPVKKNNKNNKKDN